MPTNLQTYNNVGQNQLTAENAEYYQRVMLKRLQDAVYFMKYGKKQNIPKHAGATTSWRRLEMPAVSTTAITEGVTPDGIDLTINKITATVQQYGAWTKISDFIDLVGLDPLLTEVSEMFGDHAALSMDIIVRDILCAGTNAYFAKGKANRAALAAGDTVNATDIQAIRATMVKNNVKPIRLPNGKQGYLAFTHPDMCTQLFNLQEWKDMNTYVDTSNREAGIVGQMYGIYFAEATTAKTFTDGGATGDLPGYATIVIGTDAFGIPDIAGSSKPEILVFGDGNTENPLALYKTVAWKTCFTAVRLNEKCILRYESLAA
jgi:N4-gp56 family major capsid protein